MTGKNDKAYCGVRKVPKGKHLGSISECIEKGEVRLWGREDYLKHRFLKVNKMMKMFQEDMKTAHPGKELKIMMKHKNKLDNEIEKIKDDYKTTKKHIEKNKKEVSEGLKTFVPKKKKN